MAFPLTLSAILFLMFAVDSGFRLMFTVKDRLLRKPAFTRICILILYTCNSVLARDIIITIHSL